MPTPTNSDARLAVLETKQATIERTMERMADALDRLTRIEMHHTAQAEAMAALQAEVASLNKRLDDRLTTIEKEMPTLLINRNSSFGIARHIATALLSAVIGAASAQLLHAPGTPPTVAPNPPASTAPHTSN